MTNDKKVKHGEDIDVTNVSINKDELKETIVISKNTRNNNVDSSTMIYVDYKVFILKSFVQNVTMRWSKLEEVNVKKRFKKFKNYITTYRAAFAAKNESK